MENQNNLGALLPINENGGIRAVNARDLHSFLESKRQFADWIKERINQYGFIENQDYQILASQNNEASWGGSNRIEYALSIDMAKELSMVERSEKGKQARRYFIACEKGLIQFASASQTKQPVYSLEDKFKAIDLSCKMLRVSKASKARMINSVIAPMGLPVFDYVESEGACLSAKDLLEKHKVEYRGKALKSASFNTIMEEHGYIERIERSTKDGSEKFPVLTEKGLKYGKNDEPTQGHHGKVQPRYYVNNFPQLLQELGLLQKGE